MPTGSPLKERPGYLPNPGMGYQGWTDSTALFQQTVEYRRGDHPEQGGFDWATLNPAGDTIDFTPIDDFLAACNGHGAQGSFRVLTMNGDGFGGNRVPQWVIDRGAIILDVDGEPDYRSRQYQEHWGAFVDALARRYDGDPRIAFIDISGYGKFNEWQPFAFTDLADPLGENATTDSSTRRHLVHMFVGGAGVSRVVETDGKAEGTLTYDHPGFQQTQLVMPYGGQWSSTRYVLRHYPHVGFRNDALFGPDANLTSLEQIGYGVTEVWRNAPVVFEPIIGADFSGQHDAALDVLERFHASFLHENNQLPADAEAEDLVQRIGYRYVCTDFRAPCLINAGSQLQIQSTWTNTGFTKSYPRMGQRFAVALALSNRQGEIVLSSVAANDISSWLPGEQQLVSAVLDVPSHAVGDHTVLVAIVHVLSGDRVLLPLDDYDRSDGWYPATTVLVVDPHSGRA